MPELDDLVKLASLGTSGICIFGIFWTGFLLKGGKDSENGLYHQTLHKYMNMVIAIAVITGVSGVANAYIKQSDINRLEAKSAELTDERNKLKKENQAIIAANAKVIKSIEKILANQQGATIRNTAPALKLQLKHLKDIQLPR